MQNKGNGADTYLHRVGRAGRFGTKGLAITFVASEKDSEVLNQVSLRSPHPPSSPPVPPQPAPRAPPPRGCAAAGVCMCVRACVRVCVCMLGMVCGRARPPAPS